MIKVDRISRRKLLGAGGSVLLASSLLPGCELLSTDPSGRAKENRPGKRREQRNEAPRLADLVTSGDLPPVEERLPKNPVVVEPVEQTGLYGGEWRTTLLGAADEIWMTRTVGSESLLRYTMDFKVIPNVAESYEVNDDGTEYVFTFREGMKWSDGAPYGADDIVFAQNDVFNNRDLFPAQPVNPVTAEKLDDYSVKFTFENPEGLFINDVAGNGGQDIVRLPMHYLSQFHKDYNPEIDELLEEEEAPDWTTLFLAKAGIGSGKWANPDLPVIFGWRIITPLGDGQRAVVERNPYYWKVDPDGRQLPYIDRVSFDIINDAEVILLKAMQGEIDMQDRNLGTPGNKPPLAASREEGDYRFFTVNTTEMNTTGIALNLTHSDPVKREIFNNREFRVGLSHAINRQEIIDTVFQRQGEPWQLCPRPESRYQNEQLATQYTQYDVAEANKRLDGAGYVERDSSGFRLGPDGERVAFNLSFVSSWTPEWPDVAEMLKEYWAEVGVDVGLQLQDRSLWDERGKANDFDVTIWAGQFGGDIDALIRPMWYVPIDGFVSPAPLWREWYHSAGGGGEEPPADVRQAMSLYDRIKATPDEGEQIAHMDEILELNAEMFNSIGVSLSPNKYGIVKNNLHNVPEAMPDAGPVFQQPGPTNTEQYYFS